MTGWERVLVLAPHTDDGELGAGGTIARLRDAGREVRYVALSVPPPTEALQEEVERATAVLGIAPGELRLHTFKPRAFPEQRQAILDLFVELAREYRPDAVLCPSGHDVHQDHEVVHREALRAFKHSTILGYEEPWNNYRFDYQAFITLDAGNLARKLEALACYVSQACRPYTNRPYIEALALAHGVHAGSRYAEAFEVSRLIL